MKEAHERLARAIENAGGVREAALRLGVSHESIYGAIAGRLPIGRKLSTALGLPPPTDTPEVRRRQAIKDRVLEALRSFDRPIGTGAVAVRVCCLDQTARVLLAELADEGKATRVGNRWVATKTPADVRGKGTIA